MIRINLDINKKISDDELNKYTIKDDYKEYLEKYKDYIGWYNPNDIKEEVVIDIKRTAQFIRGNCDVFIIIGIGGSYMGSKAIIESLNPYIKSKKPRIIFLGDNLSNDYLNEVINFITDKNIIINYISKSGNTLETSTILRMLMDLMFKKYSKEEVHKRVIYTVGKMIATSYKSFDIPYNIGGRYSVFTAVGLLPMAVAGYSIDKFIDGAKEAYLNKDMQNKYAVLRHIMESKNIFIEAYTIYETKLISFVEWLKQLYAESLGKSNKGILPIIIINPRDLHSLEQYLQDGKNIIFETVINVTSDKLNSLISKSVIMAHNNMMSNQIDVNILNEYNIGYLMQYFMMSCAVSGYLMGTNPFNQPGVEKYKNIVRDIIKKEQE